MDKGHIERKEKKARTKRNPLEAWMFCLVFIVSCAGRGSATCRSLVQGSLTKRVPLSDQVQQ